MNLRNRFERFCYKNRHWGIPNLMLYIVIGSALVYLLSLVTNSYILYEYLRFDKASILKGQVWRLVSFIFTESPSSNPVLTLVFLYFFYNLGRHTEMVMGTFKFNLFYFSGVLLMDIFAMIFCPTQNVQIENMIYSANDISNAFYSNLAMYLHLSLLLTFATTNPNSQFLVLFIIPVKAWFMGIVYLILIALNILAYPIYFFPHNIFPLVGLLNYLLFAGKDVLNLFPFLPRRKRPSYTPPHASVRKEQRTPPKQAAYTHRCTICGRTDVSDPDLEFRYCSRCNGYFCYCEDHISNHTHVE